MIKLIKFNNIIINIKMTLINNNNYDDEDDDNNIKGNDIATNSCTNLICTN